MNGETDLSAGQLPLPNFISRHADGLYVDLALADNGERFFAFADQCFRAGHLFTRLDYPRFLALLYEDPTPGSTSTRIRFAQDLCPFATERQALYRSIKIEDGLAIYLFEPAYLEIPVEEAEDEEGRSILPVSERRTHSERTQLDLDEFIANAWCQGILYGIDCNAVQDAIRSGKTERVVIARPRPFIPGKDAEIRPETPNLQRNNAPRKLSGGRIDLTQFENRYPQVTAGLRLFKKFPRQPGKDGRDVRGTLLPAPIPADIDLTHCSGAGTKIIAEPDGDCLLASVAGFLSLDARSGQVSITDKIISREGVSARTTGDITLTGEEYEEFGEIQEKRTVQCQSIIAHADVFGSILSHGGSVILKKNLVGGSAMNEHGDITVEGVTSGATLIAHNGVITLKKADNCLIIGRQVHIAHASRCDILAEEITLDVAEGCALAGRHLTVEAAHNSREVDSVYSLLIPDLSAFAAKRQHLQHEETRLNAAIAELHGKMASLRQQKELSHYLLIAGKLQRKELTLAPEQQEGWKKLGAQVAPALRALRQLNDDVHGLEAQIAPLHAQQASLEAAMQSACVGVGCQVMLIEGDTRIRSLAIPLDSPPLAHLPPKELRLRLRASDGAIKMLFTGDRGEFCWTYTKP